MLCPGEQGLNGRTGSTATKAATQDTIPLRPPPLPLEDLPLAPLLM